MVARILKRETNRAIQLTNGLKFRDIRPNRFSRVFVDEEHQLLYNRITKNANSTIMSYFYSMMIHESVDETEKSREQAKSQLPHLDRSIVKGNLQNYRRIVVLREPKSRILSSFLDKFSEGSVYQKRYRRFAQTPAGFEEFLHWLDAGNLRADRHWNTQMDALAFPIEFFTDIIDFKQINTAFPKILNEVGLDGEQFLTHKNARLGKIHATGSEQKMNSFWSDPTTRLVEKLYAEDFNAYYSYFPRA